MPAGLKVTGADEGSVPGVVIDNGLPLLTEVLHDESEYTLYVTVPVAVAASAPESVAAFGNCGRPWN